MFIVGIICFHWGLLFGHRWHTQNIKNKRQWIPNVPASTGFGMAPNIDRPRGAYVRSNITSNLTSSLTSTVILPNSFLQHTDTVIQPTETSTILNSTPQGDELKEMKEQVCPSPLTCFEQVTVTSTNTTRGRIFRLTGMMYVRTWAKNKMNYEFREVREWMEWIFYGGAEHIFIYDNCQTPDECLLTCLAPYIRKGLVTYIQWHPPENHHEAQIHGLTNWLQKYGSTTEWQLTMDIDEYPVMRGDIEADFLLRLIQQHRCSIYFQNQFFLDLFKPKQKGEFLMERFLRRDKNYERYPSRSKVLYQPEFVRQLNIHSADMLPGCGDRHVIPIEKGAIQHFWGFRHVDNKTNVDRFMINTVADDSMKSVARHFRSKHVPFVHFEALQSSCRSYDW